MPRVEREWFGPEIEMRVRRATGRGIVGIAMNVSRETKILTHRISGTLARSVHAAPALYMGADEDERLAPGADLGLQVPIPTQTPIGPACEVGSWLPYACVEWIGRGHPGVTQGLEAVRGPLADRVMAQAFIEERLL